MLTRKMKDSGIEWIGEIPEDWNTRRIKNILIERNLKNDPVITNVVLSLLKDRGVIPYSEKGNIGNKAKEDITKYKVAYPEDIIMNSMNVVIGSVNISRYTGVVSPVYYVLYVRNENEHDIDYINMLFQTKQFQESLKGIGNGILEHRMRIPINKLNDVILPFPSKKEQKKIVAILDEKVTYIANIQYETQQSIEELKKYKQSLITEAVTKGLDPNVEMKDSGIEWIGDIPEDWEFSRIKHEFTLNKGLTITKNDLKEEGIPVINYGEIHSISGFRFDIKTYSVKYVDKEYCISNKNSLIKKGDFIFADTSEDLDGSGNFKCYVGDSPCFAGSHTVILKPKKNINYLYFSYLFDSLVFRAQIQEKVQGIKVFSITQRILSSIIIFFPNEQEQEQIVAYLDEKTSLIDQLIADKTKIIEELESYKQSLIYEYVTGKKEV